MINEVKVFNPKGELTSIINAQELHQAKYEEIAKSVSKTSWGKSADKHLFTCPICKIEVEGRLNQATCGSPKCIQNRAYSKKSPKAFRIFKCAECKIIIKTRHHNKKICGADKCFIAFRRRR